MNASRATDDGGARSGHRSRPPTVAGTFYPGGDVELAALVDDDLAAAADQLARPAATWPKALIVPHAGYVYSGPVAASGYARLLPARGTVDRVVLLGPAHHVAVRSMAVPSVEAFLTPLGAVPLDVELRGRALESPDVVVDDAPHAPEHSLEVQLPFLQRVLGPGFRLLPVVVGQASPAAVADLLERVWGGPETLVVVSSDLSHYHDHRTATALDRSTADAITGLDLEGIGPYDACGAYPVRGLLEVARRRSLTVELLDLRNSGDTAGPRDRVVGYGAFAVA